MDHTEYIPALNTPVSGRDPTFTFRTKGPDHIWPSDNGLDSTPSPCQSNLLFPEYAEGSPPLLRRSVSWRWRSLPVEPCRFPWGRKLDTLFLNNQPASHKGTSWCQHRRNTPCMHHNLGIHPSVGAWEARGFQGHRTVRLLRKQRRPTKPWEWRVCPCREWGGWRAGTAHSRRLRCRCHVHYHGRTWETGGKWRYAINAMWRTSSCMHEVIILELHVFALTMRFSPCFFMSWSNQWDRQALSVNKLCAG